MCIPLSKLSKWLITSWSNWEYPWISHIFHRGIIWSPSVSTSSEAPQCRWPLCRRIPWPGSLHLQLPTPEPGTRFCYVFGIPIWENSGIFAENGDSSRFNPVWACLTSKKFDFFLGETQYNWDLWPENKKNMADVVGRCVSALSSQCVSQLVVEPHRERYCQLGWSRHF